MQSKLKYNMLVAKCSEAESMTMYSRVAALALTGAGVLFAVFTFVATFAISQTRKSAILDESMRRGARGPASYFSRYARLAVRGASQHGALLCEPRVRENGACSCERICTTDAPKERNTKKKLKPAVILVRFSASD